MLPEASTSPAVFNLVTEDQSAGVRPLVQELLQRISFPCSSHAESSDMLRSRRKEHQHDTAFLHLGWNLKIVRSMFV